MVGDCLPVPVACVYRFYWISISKMTQTEALEVKEDITPEWEEEFDGLTPGSDSDDLGCVNSLYEKGGYQDWLNTNPHLYEDSVYNEPMFDLSKVKVKNFIRSLLLAREQEARTKAIDEAMAVVTNKEKERMENMFEKVSYEPIALQIFNALQALKNK